MSAIDQPESRDNTYSLATPSLSNSSPSLSSTTNSTLENSGLNTPSGSASIGVASTTDRSSTDIAAATTGTSSQSDLNTRITEWRLSGSEIQADLDRSVTIVRSKDSLVGAPTGASDDAILVAMVKGKFQADSELSSSSINVEAKDGEVTLKGSAGSAAIIGKAIALALDTQGVTKVSSDIKLSAAVTK